MDTILELIRKIRVGLLTTADLGGHFHTRPVETLAAEADETLWFFTDRSSPKVDEIQHDVRVSLGYVDSKEHLYVAVSGLCSVTQDARKARELWTPDQRAYYPDGPEDARLALLCVRIERAEYWKAPGPAAYRAAAAKAAVTGVPAATVGENHKVK
ncbi:MAG TPA: pyridoxamine 5'-phosphate oxidase family protein [Steroidobacteraceae bacterium]